MRIRLPGDWSAPVALALAGTAIVFVARGASTDALAGAWIVALVYGVLAAVTGVAALRGRAVDDGSTFSWWGSLGADRAGFFFGTGLLYFGGTLLVTPFSLHFSWGATVLSLAVATGFLIFAYQFLLAATIVAFTPAKEVIIMHGKSLTFWRTRHRLTDFTALEVRIRRAYAGTYGMMSTWQRIYDIAATSPRATITLGRETTREGAQRTLAELAQRTGLPAAPLPPVLGGDTTHSVSP